MNESKAERKNRIKRSRQENRRKQREPNWHNNPNWWWVPARPGSVCDRCQELIATNARIAYDSHGRKVLCEICVDYEGIASECRESKAWRDS